MYGAIFGDVIGSPYEFDRGEKTKEFELFSEESYFTDDTVMTVAVGEALMEAGKKAKPAEIEKKVRTALLKWGRRYPDAGYGGRFYQWLRMGENAKPYGSYGNGSAMRVSAAGWLYDTVERTREAAAATARVTHDHPEGIKGAEATASVIFLARNGKSKKEIKQYISKEFGYDLSRTLDEIRPDYHHVEDCMHTVPEAITAFLEGTDYEDVVRNAVSLGGDTDTLAAIAGSMAEACYGIPLNVLMEGETYLTPDVMAVLMKFDREIGRDPLLETDPRKDNRRLKRVVAQYYQEPGNENFALLLEMLVYRMMEDGEVLTPVRDMEAKGGQGTLGGKETSGKSAAPERPEKQGRLSIDVLRDSEGKDWIPLFTDDGELGKRKKAEIYTKRLIRDVLTLGYVKEEVAGVVINPYGQSMAIPKDGLRIALEQLEGNTAPGRI